MSLMAFSNSLILSSNLRAAFQNALLIFFGFKTIFLNVYLEVVNFIDFLFQRVTQSVRGRDVLLLNRSDQLPHRNLEDF